jgi:tetratricopeptide (TPR) repeat protein
MQVFISWAGSRSKTLAVLLHEWLKTVVQRANPWMSDHDIEAGQRWNVEISLRLKETNFGIICLTPENLNASWLLFEAGALAKAIDTARVVPVLLGLRKSDLTFPLAQFQAVEANRDGFFALASALNKGLGDDQLSPITLNTIFNGLWPNLESEVIALCNAPSLAQTQVKRSDREVLQDVLESVRTIQRTIGSSARASHVSELGAGDWEDYYIKGVNFANQRGGIETDIAALCSYAQAIAIAPQDLLKNTFSRLYAYRAALLKRLGRLEEAKNDLVLAKQWASENREINDAIYNMACVLAMSGEVDQAIDEIKTLIARDPVYLRVVTTKSYFKNIAEHPDFKALTNNTA